ncbi:MAG: cell division protein FtsL [Stagnimonas sp.]|nr:cell division protein FtsL [Stagnimonas sp.]
MSAALTRRLPPRKAPSGSGLMLPLLLAVAAMVSAVTVVQVKHGNRALTTEQSRLRELRDQLEVEWSQLQLEEAAHSSHARIEQIAREQLKMVEPRETVMVQAPVTGVGR